MLGLRQRASTCCCTYSCKSKDLYIYVQSALEMCDQMSVLLVQLRWIGAAGGRDDAVEARGEKHLPVRVGIGPDDHGGEAEPRVGAGIPAFYGVGHILCGRGPQGLAPRGKRGAHTLQQFL